MQACLQCRCTAVCSHSSSTGPSVRAGLRKAPAALRVVRGPRRHMSPPAPGLLDGAAAQGDIPCRSRAVPAAERPADGMATPAGEEGREVPVSSSTALDGISASAAEPTCSNGSDSLSGLAPVRVNPVARWVSHPYLRRYAL